MCARAKDGESHSWKPAASRHAAPSMQRRSPHMETRNNIVASCANRVNISSVASHTYSWDDADRLTKFDNATGTDNDAVYAYLPGSGMRYKRTQGATVEYYIYDGDDVLGSYTAGGTLNARYVTPGLDDNLSETRGGSTYYYMQDGLGSVRNLVDSSETTQNIYDTYAFGDNIAYAQTVNIASPYRYTGREFELGSYDSTHYYRNRYYLPYLGIFASRDAAFADIHRGWGYVGNNPLMFVDPWGLDEGRSLYTVIEYINSLPYSERAKREMREQARHGQYPPGFDALRARDVLQTASDKLWNAGQSLTYKRSGANGNYACGEWVSEMHSRIPGMAGVRSSGTGGEYRVGNALIYPVTGDNWGIWGHEAWAVETPSGRYIVDPYYDHDGWPLGWLWRNFRPVLTLRNDRSDLKYNENFGVRRPDSGSSTSEPSLSDPCPKDPC